MNHTYMGSVFRRFAEICWSNEWMQITNHIDVNGSWLFCYNNQHVIHTCCAQWYCTEQPEPPFLVSPAGALGAFSSVCPLTKQLAIGVHLWALSWAGLCAPIDTNSMTRPYPLLPLHRPVNGSCCCLCDFWGKEERPVPLQTGTGLDRNRTYGSGRTIQKLGHFLP